MTTSMMNPPRYYTVGELERHFGRDAVVLVTVDDPYLVEAELAAAAPRRQKAWLLLVLCVLIAAATLLGYALAERRADRAFALLAGSCRSRSMLAEAAVGVLPDPFAASAALTSDPGATEEALHHDADELARTRAAHAAR